MFRRIFSADAVDFGLGYLRKGALTEMRGVFLRPREEIPTTMPKKILILLL